MNPPPLEVLDAHDAPVVADFKQTWSTTPFTTFPYFAEQMGSPFPNMPGGNCFEFAIVFSTKPSVTDARLMCHPNHGNVSFKSATQNRYYTVDSGFNTPVKMPAPATRTEFSFEVVANVLKPANKPDASVDNKETYYNLKYETGTGIGLWGTDHYIKGKKGFVPMVQTTVENARGFAKANALGQTSCIFLSRLLVNGEPSWGPSVFMTFKGGQKGKLVIKLPKKNDIHDEVITLDIRGGAHEEELVAAKAKLAQRIIDDNLTVQWTADTSECFDLLINKLKEL